MERHPEVGEEIAKAKQHSDEFRAIQDPNKRDALTAWEQELADYFAENFDQSQGEPEGSSYSEMTHFTSLQRSRMADLLKAFPDKKDQQLWLDWRPKTNVCMGHRQYHRQLPQHVSP